MPAIRAPETPGRASARSGFVETSMRDSTGPMSSETCHARDVSSFGSRDDPPSPGPLARPLRRRPAGGHGADGRPPVAGAARRCGAVGRRRNLARRSPAIATGHRHGRARRDPSRARRRRRGRRDGGRERGGGAQRLHGGGGGRSPGHLGRYGRSTACAGHGEPHRAALVFEPSRRRRRPGPSPLGRRRIRARRSDPRARPRRGGTRHGGSARQSDVARDLWDRVEFGEPRLVDRDRQRRAPCPLRARGGPRRDRRGRLDRQPRSGRRRGADRRYVRSPRPRSAAAHGGAAPTTGSA